MEISTVKSIDGIKMKKCCSGYPVFDTDCCGSESLRCITCKKSVELYESSSRYLALKWNDLIK